MMMSKRRYFKFYTMEWLRKNWNFYMLIVLFLKQQNIFLSPLHHP